MTRQEKLILLLVTLAGLARLSLFWRDVHLAETYGSNVPADVEMHWNNISVAFSHLTSLGAALWLYLEAKTIGLKAWVWSLFGLVFGLFGLALFYLIQIYAKKRASEI